MKKTLLTTLLLLIALCVCAIAEPGDGTNDLFESGGRFYYEFETPLPTVVSIEVDGKMFMRDTSESLVMSRGSTCGICDFQLGNRAPELDKWARYSSTHHQYRTYYHAMCTNCHTAAYVYVPGDIQPHRWKYDSDRHAWDEYHAIVEHCVVCGESIINYVFCPGPDGGGCTVVY